jgi:23S rRNA (adenine1618-N6)-methyltransferase
MELDTSRKLPYTAVDFQDLAKNDESFKQIWENGHGHLDFHDSLTCQILTRTILRVDFGLKLDLPEDRLCPPVPNRWNYVAWIQALLDSTSPDHNVEYDPERKVVGLDIGTGASAIYSLLALKSRPNWTMCITDVDKKSIDWAARNLALNNMMTRAKMLLQMEDAPVIPFKYLGAEKLDFTICNPPFFTNTAEMQSSIKGEGKIWKPNAICTGSENEMVYPGGDLAFVRRIIDESMVLRENVTWYSSMLGKLNSAKAVVDLLRQRGITNWAVGCLEPGHTTKRWIVAWSFGDLRPRNVSTI